MNRCELNEIAVSALVDGALAKSELLPTLDHLLECPACRSFYRESRALSGLLAVPEAGSREEPAPGPPAEPPSDEVWERIEAESARRRLPAWAARAAAVLLLALGGWWAASQPSVPLTREEAPREVVLGGSGGGMSEQRFVALATEVLEADPRYRREMLRVLSAVSEETGRPEAPVEDGTLTEDDGSPREEGAGGRA